MRILITGGAGFIGSHLVDHFHHSAEVVVLDNLRSGHRRNLYGLKHRFIEGSIKSTSTIMIHTVRRFPSWSAGIPAIFRT